MIQVWTCIINDMTVVYMYVHAHVGMYNVIYCVGMYKCILVNNTIQYNSYFSLSIILAISWSILSLSARLASNFSRSRSNCFCLNELSSALFLGAATGSPYIVFIWTSGV